MRVTFLQNLGLSDARLVNEKLNAGIDPTKLPQIGDTIELPDRAAEYLGSKYPALFESATVRGVAKKPEVTAPAK